MAICTLKESSPHEDNKKFRDCAYNKQKPDLKMADTLFKVVHWCSMHHSQSSCHPWNVLFCKRVKHRLRFVWKKRPGNRGRGDECVVVGEKCACFQCTADGHVGRINCHCTTVQVVCAKQNVTVELTASSLTLGDMHGAHPMNVKKKKKTLTCSWLRI